MALASFHLPRSASVSSGECFALFSSFGYCSRVYKGPSGNLFLSSALTSCPEPVFACWLRVELAWASPHLPDETGIGEISQAGCAQSPRASPGISALL